MNSAFPGPFDDARAARLRLKAFLTARLGDESHAEELLQLCLPKALRWGGPPPDGVPLVTWLLQVLRRAIVDHIRSHETAAARERAWNTAVAVSHVQDQHALAAWLEPLIAGLPALQAALLHLIEIDFVSPSVAAQALAISAADADAALHEGRATLALRIGPFLASASAPLISRPARRLKEFPLLTSAKRHAPLR